MAAEDAFAYALSSNQAWAGYKAHQNPDFFPKLAGGQSPAIRKFHPVSYFLVYFDFIFPIPANTLLRWEIEAKTHSTER